MNGNRGELNISLLRYLLDNGAKCDTLCPSGDSAMHLAVKHGNWYIIEELLQDKIEKQFAFMSSSKERFSSRAQVSQFMEKHANTHNSKTDRKQSARAPFNINAKNLCGNTVLHLSTKTIYWDQIRTLLTCGADASLTDDEGHTVLYRLAAKEWKTAENDPHMLKALKILSKVAACTMEKDEFGDTLIQIAAKNKNVQIVDMLLNYVDDVNIRDKDGLTILHRVVQCTSPVSLKIVKTLMKRKADIEIAGPHGDTALHLAAQWENWDIVQELLENGARADNTDSQGMSVLHRLLRRDNSSCKPATYSLLSGAFCSTPRNYEERKLPFVKLMIKSGVDINTKDENGFKAIQLALIKKEWEVIQFLYECGANVDQNDLSEGKSFLHELANDTSVDVQIARSFTQRILSRGLCLNEREAQGDTPLNLAAKCGNWKMVCVFLKYGADVSLPDSQGWFVSHRLAMDSGKLSHHGISLSYLLLLLTTKGFKVNQTGPDGRSCIQLSLEHRKWDLFWWLVESESSYFFTFQEKKTILQHVYLITNKNSDPRKVRILISCVTDKGNSSCQELAECKNEALKMTFSNCNWVVAKILVECGADIGLMFGTKPLMHLLMLKYRPQDHRTWLSFLDALLARGADINSRDENGRTILFQAWRRYPTGKFRLKSLNSLLHQLLERRASPIVADNEGKSLLIFVHGHEKRLALQSVKWLIKIGVSTHQPAITDNTKTHSLSGSVQASTRSPTQRAFEKKYVRAFEILVESGASSNRELFDLNTRYQVELSTRDKTSAETQMLDILNHAASQPRSLKSLCRLTVSHALGCCSRRTAKVKSLPLPSALQDYIQFCDVFTTDEEEA
ncbi:ankyrin-3-like [Pomacea canaliculata]|uniref:ankyrin-3-like n=1 Tax=Pomacea canaliculata TaxID=400727 RepID=UPI000D72E93C|nr:ankyrin-3-like [Pomacea canaliculata]